jgi:hypothetical protein
MHWYAFYITGSLDRLVEFPLCEGKIIEVILMQTYQLPVFLTTMESLPSPPPADPPLAPLSPPPAEVIYTDTIAAKSALQDHALKNGYDISIASSRDQRAYYMCAKRGKYNNKGKVPTVHPSRQRKNAATMKTDCPFCVVAKKNKMGWKVEVLENNHNPGPLLQLQPFHSTELQPWPQRNERQWNELWKPQS